MSEGIPVSPAYFTAVKEAGLARDHINILRASIEFAIKYADQYPENHQLLYVKTILEESVAKCQL